MKSCRLHTHFDDIDCWLLCDAGPALKQHWVNWCTIFFTVSFLLMTEMLVITYSACKYVSSLVNGLIHAQRPNKYHEYDTLNQFWAYAGPAS